MRRRVPTALAVAIILMIVGAFAGYAYFGDTCFKQARRMKLGRGFLPGITNVLRSHPEFRYVQVDVGTAKAGCFLVVGVVDTREEFSTLQSVIAGTKPPLDVVYRLKVLDDYRDRPSAELGGAANGSQPFRPETNHTSSAAGSRR